MDNKSEDQFLIMQASNDKLFSECTKMKSHMKKIYSESTNMSSDINDIKKILTRMMIQKRHYSPYNMDSSQAQYTSTAFLTNTKAPPLEGGSSKKISGM